MSRTNVCREGRSVPDNQLVTACYSVSAAADPSVMARIMAIFAKRGMVPSHWHSRVSGPENDELQIDVQMGGVSVLEAEKFAQAMRQIVCVERVLTSSKEI